MALIEEVPLEDNEQEIPQNCPSEKPKSMSSDTTTNSEDTAARPSEGANVRDHDSDGFETASEHDLSDNEEDKQEENQHCDNAGNDEERNEEALAQANSDKLEGNRLFGKSKFEEALLQYDMALQVAPDLPSSTELRSICHANCAICFSKLGKYEEAVKEFTKALEINPSYVKALKRRGEAHEKLEHYEEAVADLKKILELEPSNEDASQSIKRLEPLAAEEHQKEALGKLKEMGNSLLGRFGMSVDNFKVVQDPNTGSYSISFQN